MLLSCITGVSIELFPCICLRVAANRLYVQHSFFFPFTFSSFFYPFPSVQFVYQGWIEMFSKGTCGPLVFRSRYASLFFSPLTGGGFSFAEYPRAVLTRLVRSTVIHNGPVIPFLLVVGYYYHTCPVLHSGRCHAVIARLSFFH